MDPPTSHQCPFCSWNPRLKHPDPTCDFCLGKGWLKRRESRSVKDAAGRVIGTASVYGALTATVDLSRAASFWKTYLGG